jgi:putative N6-adenine-specific DNA methylase
MEFYAPCPRGLEGPLEEELRELGIERARVSDSGVAFVGDVEAAMRVNLHSRIASRVLMKLSHGTYEREEDIYTLARDTAWEEWFDASLTLKVETSAIRCPLKSIDYLTLKVKDAICDRFREREGERPSIDVRHPQVQVTLHLNRFQMTLYLDTSGAGLFRRGLDRSTGLAPLKKNLAAGILRLIGWTPDQALYDPMCGSGTFLTEAAEISLNRAPGLARNFGFEWLDGFPARVWQTLKEEAAARARPATECPLWGSDLRGDAVAMTRANLAALGLEEAVHLKQVDILESSAPTEGGILVMNPPYGQRIGEDEDLKALYPKIGDVLKRRYPGWRAFILTGDMRLPKLIRLSVGRRIPVFNGQIDCRVFEYELTQGSRREL